MSAILFGIVLISLVIFSIVAIAKGKKLLGSGASPTPTPAGRRFDPINIGIGVAGLISMVVVYNYYTFNFFESLVVGVGMVWIGGKLAKGSNSIAVLWGKILRILGWAFLAFTLLNPNGSGVRVTAEKFVLWANDSLKGQSTSNPVTEKGVNGGGINLPKIFAPSELEEVKLGGAPVGTEQEITIPLTGRVKVHLGTPMVNSPPFWVCIKTPEGINPPLKFEQVAGSQSSVKTFRLFEESIHRALKIGVSTIRLTIKKASGFQDPCPALGMQ